MDARQRKLPPKRTAPTGPLWRHTGPGPYLAPPRPELLPVSVVPWDCPTSIGDNERTASPF
ncbi:hypothetical protein BDV23DRAFT_147851 [Aspergillus alliaceus]|uniref:Uncharacterized protein n=1 Tax=Petromyces alliaceus TaxID=209559 RepID=A0A5N7CLP4_PETAA|nr:hypothetical protein BDV23DRAFT_147851 [Aspergillus alliaceus]